jgi:hypothetical protein
MLLAAALGRWFFELRVQPSVNTRVILCLGRMRAKDLNRCTLSNPNRVAPNIPARINSLSRQNLRFTVPYCPKFASATRNGALDI